VSAAVGGSPTTRPRGKRARRSAVAAVGPTRIVGATLMVWLLVAIASVPWWPVYRSDAMLLAGVTAVGVGTAVALVGAVTRLPAVVVGMMTVVGFALTGVPAAVPSEANGILPTLGGLVDLFASVALGWKRLVTISLPVGDYEALLVPYFALVLVGTVVGVSVGTRARRQELASIPALVLFAAAIVIGPTTLGFSVVTAVVLAGVALVWSLTARHVRRAVSVATTVGGRVGFGRSVVRPALVGTATIAAAAVVAWGIGLVASPTGTREVARASVVKPFDPRDYVSPLSGFRAYEESDEADRAQLRVSGLPADGFVRIATLDTYDGIVYSVGGEDGSRASGTFERVPTSVDVHGVSGRQVNVSVQVAGYSGVWLPTVGDLESVRFAGPKATSQRGDFYYNRSTGTAAVVGGVSSGTSYDLTAVVPSRPSDTQLDRATPGSDAVPQPTRVPDAVQDTVQAYTAGVSGAGAKLQAMLTALKQNGYVSHGVGDERPSRSGHGADRIQELLTSSLMLGDAEQYAVAASLMAQQLGFPARVVLGFSPDGDAGGSSASAASTTTFTGKDITARIEVDTAQYGWVLLDPNPAVREIPTEQQQTPKPVTRPETIVPPPPAAQQDQDTQSPPQSDRKNPSVQPLWLTILLAALPWAIATLALVALVLLPFGVVLLVKRVRRRRRNRAPTGLGRVVGAWDEYRDALLDHGHPVAASATRREVAMRAPGSGASGIAALADRAVFGPTDVDPTTADRMWEATTAEIAGLDDGRTRWQRFRAATSLRSLRGRRPRRAVAPGSEPADAGAPSHLVGASAAAGGARYDGGSSSKDRGTT
jgi:hypothetical protein